MSLTTAQNMARGLRAFHSMQVHEPPEAKGNRHGVVQSEAINAGPDRGRWRAHHPAARSLSTVADLQKSSPGGVV